MIDALTLDHVFRKRPMDPRIPQDLVSRFLPLHASRLDGSKLALKRDGFELNDDHSV